VADAATGMTIPTTTILVVTVAGTYEFMGGLFEISFPAETVANIRAQAPGYKAESRQVKGHYQRSVGLDMEIRLERSFGTLSPVYLGWCVEPLQEPSLELNDQNETRCSKPRRVAVMDALGALMS